MSFLSFDMMMVIAGAQILELKEYTRLFGQKNILVSALLMK